jgi:hypothetical protein
VGWLDGGVSVPQLIVILSIIAYWIAFAIARRRMIARPVAAARDAQRHVLATELHLADIPERQRRSLLDLIDATGSEQQRRPRQGWLWNGEHELNALVREDAVRLLLLDAYPPTEVRARLHGAVVAGRVTSEQATAIQELLRPESRRRRLRAAIRGDVPGPQERAEQARAILKEIEYGRLARVRVQYRRTLTLHRKVWWFTSLAVGAVLLLSLVEAALTTPLLAGAVGGLLATVFRVTRAREVPRSYQTSWAIITLAVPVGALAGAATVVLIAALGTLEIVGGPLTAVGAYLDDCPAPSPGICPSSPERWLVAAFAFVAGFSARLLEGLAKRLEEAVTSSKAAATPSDAAA